MIYDQSKLIFPSNIEKVQFNKDSPILEIYTDGGTTNNGKETAFGGYAFLCHEKNNPLTIGYSSHIPGTVTNNRAEIMGVIAAIITMNKQNCKMVIHSDSQYVVKTVNEWRKNWHKRDKTVIKNYNLFNQLFELIDKAGNIELKWVKGHSNSDGNNVADRWATNAMKGIEPNSIQKEKCNFYRFSGLEGFLYE